MPLLHLHPLPYRCKTGKLFSWILDNSGLKKQNIGKISIQWCHGEIEIPVNFGARLASKLNGLIFEDQSVEAWFEDSEISHSENQHFQKLLQLVSIEARAEANRIQEEMDRHGSKEKNHSSATFNHLVISETKYGLGAQIIVTLKNSNVHQTLPKTRLRVGSPILLSETPKKNEPVLRGVISHLTPTYLQVSFSEINSSALEGAKYRLDLAEDEVSRQREKLALRRVNSADCNRIAELRTIFLGELDFSFKPAKSFSPINPNLNSSQIEAIQFALSAKDIAIIHGPPGTGKTTTVVELIQQAIRNGERVLACAPSNLAVDNLLQRLVVAQEKVVRLGNLVRITSHLREFSLDGLVEINPDFRRARKLKREAEALVSKAKKESRRFVSREEREGIFEKADNLRSDAQRIEKQVLNSILDKASVICSTLHGLDSRILQSRYFDLLVVDEAGQCTEPAAWIPIPRCNRVVLAGDHCQLPPTVISGEAVKKGYHISLMERLVKKNGTRIAHRLNTQYRMHQDIMGFSSCEFYEQSLVAHESVVNHLLSEMGGVEGNDLTNSAVHFIDTSGSGYNEQAEIDGNSIFNKEEGHLVNRKVKALVNAGVPLEKIAILTPYAAQVRLLRDLVEASEVEVSTIDGYQGRENEVVLISFVRSNPKKEIGFLADVRRMNVALTRARRKLMVFGDSSTISGHEFYDRLLDYFDRIGAYYGVWDED